MSDPEIYHIIPIDDLREHLESKDCWCSPELDEECTVSEVWIHNSLDERELFENGVRKFS